MWEEAALLGVAAIFSVIIYLSPERSVHGFFGG